MNKKKNMMAAAVLLAGTLAVSGCKGGLSAEPGRASGKENVPDSKGLLVKTVAQAVYPQEPEYQSDDDRWEARRSREIPEAFAKAYSSFAYKTAAGILGADTGENIVYSPMGLYYALAVSAQGAGGETRREILELLGYPGEEADRPGIKPEDSERETGGLETETGLPERETGGLETETSRSETEKGDGNSDSLKNLARDCQTAFQALYHVPNPANCKADEWGEMPADALYNLRIANSLWADDTLKVKQVFADQAAQYFYCLYTGVKTLAF